MQLGRVDAVVVPDLTWPPRCPRGTGRVGRAGGGDCEGLAHIRATGARCGAAAANAAGAESVGAAADAAAT
eukprot:15066392-Alexandrium_andersonii.AAC.1